MPLKMSERLAPLSYAIRDLVPIANEIERMGGQVIRLNIGDPLKFDFDTPQHIKDALCEAINSKWNFYSPSVGDDELRAAIAEKEKKYNGVEVDPKNVIVTTGVSEAINFIAAAFLDPGDEALIPGPAYAPYMNFIQLYGGKPIHYKCIEKEGWKPDLDDIRRKVTERTRFILIINPNNPTGAVYDEKVVEGILNIAAEHEIPVVSDEIYDRITYDDANFKSTAAISRDVPVVGLNGFSKVYLMTGWRLGYIYVKDPTEKYLDKIMGHLVKLARARLCACTPVMRAGIAALRGPQDHVNEMVSKLKVRRDYCCKRISEIPGLSVVKPMGAFYLFPKVQLGNAFKSDKDFALKLLHEEKVLIVHGSGFGAGGESHFRSIYLPPINVLEEAFNRIEKFCKKYLA